MATFSRHAVLTWNGDTTKGTGHVSAGTASFDVPVIFPSLRGDPPGRTTPEELLAASHAVCYGIGLRSLIARRGGTADRLTVTVTITADKGPSGIRVVASHLKAVVTGLSGIDVAQLPEIGRATEEGCTISAAIRSAVAIHVEVVAA